MRSNALEPLRLALYALTILSVTVTWCLAAAFLALTHIHLNTYWRGDVCLLVFGIVAMLVLPCLAVLGHRRHRSSMTGPTIAEALTLFALWCLFLGATAKFSSTYHDGLTGWNRRCRFGSHACGTGRALLSFGWISFGLLSFLLPIAIAHGILAQKEVERDDATAARDHKNGPPPPPPGGAQTTYPAGGPGNMPMTTQMERPVPPPHPETTV
ncbi:hypothetical protein JCM10212_001152 [Sporobolomyces blumeae]